MANSDSPLRLGIYGGTFDPPHLGHLILAETAADTLALNRVLFVPAADPPHKESADVRTPVQHRLAMVERAVVDNPRFDLSRVDVDRPGPHYTADMLRLLRDEFPGAELYFLIGADSLRDLPAWSRPAEILEQAQLGVMRRPGVEPDLIALARVLPDLPARIAWIDAPLIDIAARDLARRIAAGTSVRYQVPDVVRAYIQEHGLYRSH
ncbi:MAG: nicotinate (nicotinamide) nucleotide adenylyltransferase [Anaerolineae bacterium]|nr:nicotinate (nicotinamide) nucleotide adenylyltransferase [Anaerolineae bacterium]